MFHEWPKTELPEPFTRFEWRGSDRKDDPERAGKMESRKSLTEGG